MKEVTFYFEMFPKKLERFVRIFFNSNIGNRYYLGCFERQLGENRYAVKNSR